MLAGLIASLAVLAAAPPAPRESPPNPVVSSYASVSRAAPEAWFEDVTDRSGITFQAVNGDGEQVSVVEQNGQGIAVLDFDRDGFPDLMFVNGSTLARLRAGQAPAPCALYRNRGDGTFEDVTRQAGVFQRHWSMGAAAADISNRGYADLYLSELGGNQIFENDGDGTFRESPGARGAQDGGYCNGASLGDVDGDGLLDLVVCHYVHFDPRSIPTREADGSPCTYRGLRTGCAPWRWEGEGIELFQSDGVRFVRRTESAGLARHADARAFQALLMDLDGDGSPDLYIGTDVMPNVVMRNDGKGHFTDVPAWGGTLNGEGKYDSSMGLTAGDLDGDGLPELFMTNFADQKDTLLRNNSPPASVRFSDATTAAGLDVHRPELGWGATLTDFDGDGRLDVFLVNGHIYPQVAALHDPVDSYAQPPRCYRGAAGGRFEEVAPLPFAETRWSARGLAVADLDNDGWPDLVVGLHDGRPHVLANRVGPRRAGTGFLALELVGTSSNRDAIGARVTLECAGARQVRWQVPHQGFLGTQDARVYFGLAARPGLAPPVADRVSVRWPSGKQSAIDRPAVGSTLRMVEP